MSVEAILKSKDRNLFTVRPDHSVSEAASLMASKKVGVTIVTDTQGRIAGILSERDIVSGITQYGKGVVEMPVRNLMTSLVATCSPRDSVKKILETMNERRIRHLPVVEHEELIGIVSIGDAVNFRLKEAQLEMGVLRDFAATR
ncbi:MAG: CBS domain-containing protein [Solirubrobacterales bacterium]